jgi:hypothetical protein
LLALLWPATAAAAPLSTESYQTLLGQIDSNQVRAATVNRKAHDVKVTLADGSIQHVIYPSRDARQLVARFNQHGAHVKFSRKKLPAVHHHLRYIAAGVVGGLILIGAVVWLVQRRRPGAPPSTDASTAPAAGQREADAGS